MERELKIGILEHYERKKWMDIFKLLIDDDR